MAVRRFASGTSPESSLCPLRGFDLVFFSHVDSMKGAKLGSKDSVCVRLFRQASNDVIVSERVRLHRLGGRPYEAAMVTAIRLS